jgi:hypothetical protein
MKIHLLPPDWTSDDIENFRSFLDTPTGKNLIARLTWQRPDFDVSGDATQRLVTAGRVEGYEECVADLAALAFPPQNDVVSKSPNPEYPDIEDDKAWEPASPNS